MNCYSYIKSFAMFLAMTAACGKEASQDYEIVENPGIDESPLQLLHFNSEILERSTWQLTDIAFTDRKQCEHGINLYNSLHPEDNLPNPYAFMDTSAVSFSVEGQESRYYYALQPSRVNKIKFELSYSSDGSVPSPQTISLICPIPLQWRLKVYHDVQIIFPEALKSYASPALTNPEVIGIGAKGGFGFQYLDSVGHELFFSWSLLPYSTKLEQIISQIRTRHSYINTRDMISEESDLIKSGVRDPLSILSFIEDKASMQVDSLFVKHLPSFQGDLYLSPYFRDFANTFDYHIEDAFESMLINGSAAISAMRHINYPSLQPTSCRYEAPLTSNENCYTFNKRNIFSKFAKLFSDDEPKSQSVCVLAHYQSNLPDQKGVSKLICIDGNGDQKLHYNGIHQYINEAIQIIQSQARS